MYAWLSDPITVALLFTSLLIVAGPPSVSLKPIATSRLPAPAPKSGLAGVAGSITGPAATWSVFPEKSCTESARPPSAPAVEELDGVAVGADVAAVTVRLGACRVTVTVRVVALVVTVTNWVVVLVAPHPATANTARLPAIVHHAHVVHAP